MDGRVESAGALMKEVAANGLKIRKASLTLFPSPIMTKPEGSGRTNPITPADTGPPPTDTACTFVDSVIN